MAEGDGADAAIPDIDIYEDTHSALSKGCGFQDINDDSSLENGDFPLENDNSSLENAGSSGGGRLCREIQGWKSAQISTRGCMAVRAQALPNSLTFQGCFCEVAGGLQGTMCSSSCSRTRPTGRPHARP